MEADSDARLQLFCFPYAGGGAWVFRPWARQLAGVEVCAIELPGRGTRVREPPLTTLATVVSRIAQALAAAAEKPFAFFGHSMGALIAFEVARQLRRESSAEPVHLFVSGREAPHVAQPNGPYHQLPHDELMQVLRSLNGTPMDVLANPELMQLLLPVLRADLEMVETYAYSDAAPLKCAITAFGGTRDSTVRPEKLAAWRDQTNASFTVHMIEGDHFFLHDVSTPLLRLLSEESQPYTR